MTGCSLTRTFRQASDRGLAVLMLLLLMLASPDSGAAQPPRDTLAGSAQSRLPSADDKTGTNPLNLQQTVTVLNDFESLPDGFFFDRAVYRYTMPLARRRLAARVELPLAMSNVTGRTEAGFGDLGGPSGVDTPAGSTHRPAGRYRHDLEHRDEQRARDRAAHAGAIRSGRPVPVSEDDRRATLQPAGLRRR